MQVVGFDVGKDAVFGARLDSSHVVKERFEITNEAVAIEPALTSLKQRYKRLLIGSEATGDYHRPLALACLQLGIPFRLLNPITTKQFTRATVRKMKTDPSDAVVVAKLLLQGEGTLITDGTFNPAKTILRTGCKLTHLKQSLTLMEKHLGLTMPGEATLSAELRACADRIDTAIAAFRRTAAQCLAPDDVELLSSIPGIGPVTAGTLLSEIGDINRFNDAKALVAYAGLDPRVRQSGYSLQRNTRLTKRGSPYLRQAMYFAAGIAKRHDETLRAVFDKKISEGKRYKEANIVVTRKLLHRVYAVLKRKTVYEIRG